MLLAQNWWPKVAMLTSVIRSHDASARTAKRPHGMRQAAVTITTLRARTTSEPRRISQLERQPPATLPRSAAIHGIDVSAPTFRSVMPRWSDR
jgi:hypothetical protein